MPGSADGGADTDLIVLLGPTASGKTLLAVELARRMGSEIISADSRQVYRGLNLGAGKDLEEYGEIPYHLIDIVDLQTEFSVFDFQVRFDATFEALRAREVLPILVGGTGLYIDSVVNAYELSPAPVDEALREELRDWSMSRLRTRLQRSLARLHNVTDTEERGRLVRAIEVAEAGSGSIQRDRPVVHPLVLGVRLPRAALRDRITKRLRHRLEAGLIEEVRSLHDSGVSFARLELLGLEYRYVARHLQGELNRNDMYQKLNSAIHAFARRQETWFRRMERRGTAIHWLDGEGDMVARAFEVLAEALPRLHEDPL